MYAGEFKMTLPPATNTSVESRSGNTRAWQKSNEAKPYYDTLLGTFVPPTAVYIDFYFIFVLVWCQRQIQYKYSTDWIPLLSSDSLQLHLCHTFPYKLEKLSPPKMKFKQRKESDAPKCQSQHHPSEWMWEMYSLRYTHTQHNGVDMSSKASTWMWRFALVICHLYTADTQTEHRSAVTTQTTGSFKSRAFSRTVPDCDSITA